MKTLPPSCFCISCISENFGSNSDIFLLVYDLCSSHRSPQICFMYFTPAHCVACVHYCTEYWKPVWGSVWVSQIGVLSSGCPPSTGIPHVPAVILGYAVSPWSLEDSHLQNILDVLMGHWVHFWCCTAQTPPCVLQFACTEGHLEGCHTPYNTIFPLLWTQKSTWLIYILSS